MSRAGCSPLELDGEPMPIESFHNLYHVPGFKYEYADGRTDISVQRSAQATVAAPTDRVLERTDPSLPDGVEMESAPGTPVEELESLWVNAFARRPDYYGWSIGDIRDDAREALGRLFGEKKALHPVSLVAHWRGDVAAALLVNENKTRPLVELLCVRQDLRRRGVAGALVHRVAHRLMSEGTDEEDRETLCSGHLLANQESAAWHEATGFVELPDWLVLTHRYRCLQHNLRRGLKRDVFGARRRADSLQATLNKMKEERRSDPLAYSPSRWLMPEEEGDDQTDEEASSLGSHSSPGSRIDEYLDSHFDWIDGLDPV